MWKSLQQPCSFFPPHLLASTHQGPKQMLGFLEGVLRNPNRAPTCTCPSTRVINNQNASKASLLVVYHSGLCGVAVTLLVNTNGQTCFGIQSIVSSCGSLWPISEHRTFPKRCGGHLWPLLRQNQVFARTDLAPAFENVFGCTKLVPDSNFFHENQTCVEPH